VTARKNPATSGAGPEVLPAGQRFYRWIRRLGILGGGWLPDRTGRGSATEFSIGLFPDGHAFGFTIVQDADGAYSRRLRPLFEVFDELGFKITATAFVLWADWAGDGAVWRAWREAEPEGREFFAPQCVPLADDQEREFYRDLARRGHEIGMHTPSDTSSTRHDVIRAFKSRFMSSIG
jgi:hypothetical protein